MRKKNLVSLVWLTKYEEGHILFSPLSLRVCFTVLEKNVNLSPFLEVEQLKKDCVLMVHLSELSISCEIGQVK